MKDSRRVLGGLMVLLAVCGAVLLYHVEPRQGSIYPPCMFHYLTGLYCPGCGVTRMLHALVHGRFGQAFWHNPLLALILPPLGLWMLYSFLRWQGFLPETEQHLSARSRYRISLLLLILILIFWIARNIPFYPFTLLAP